MCTWSTEIACLRAETNLDKAHLWLEPHGTPSKSLQSHRMLDYQNHNWWESIGTPILRMKVLLQIQIRGTFYPRHNPGEHLLRTKKPSDHTSVITTYFLQVWVKKLFTNGFYSCNVSVILLSIYIVIWLRQFDVLVMGGIIDYDRPLKLDSHLKVVHEGLFLINP